MADWRIFSWEGGVVQGRSKSGSCGGPCEISKKAKKGESLNRPQLKRTEVLDAVNWTRWRVGVGASFWAKDVVQGRSKTTPTQVNVKTRKKTQKKASAVTQTYGGFRRCELDTVAGWGWRIFLWEGVVQGRSKTTPTARQCERQKNAKKANHGIGRNSSA